MNSGDIDGAIECFQTAREKDAEEGVIDVDGLLTLGSALEAVERTDEAAALYEEIYTQTPSRTEAYVNHIRILQNSGNSKDLVKAGELMKLAYEKTGEKTFQTQRSDLLPAPPEVKPIAGYYETKKTLIFSSYQGYDVYYTYNNEEAVLPQDGIKATKDGFMLDEGIYNIRAVAVHGDLVSDELRGMWKIIMPSPMTPRATLAPNTYKTRQSVKLKPGLDDERDTSIVIYYTIDGSVPDSDSPIFDGEPINLPKTVQHAGNQIQDRSQTLAKVRFCRGGSAGQNEAAQDHSAGVFSSLRGRNRRRFRTGGRIQHGLPQV